jgi:hypothetical protein
MGRKKKKPVSESGVEETQESFEGMEETEEAEPEVPPYMGSEVACEEKSVEDPEVPGKTQESFEGMEETEEAEPEVPGKYRKFQKGK